MPSSFTLNNHNQRRQWDPARNKRINPYNLALYLEKRWRIISAGIIPGQHLDGVNILDVGCGEGILFAKFADTGAHLFGLDLSLAVIQKAAHRLPRCNFAVAFAECAPFKSASFDVVTANAVLHHVNDQREVLSEMIRVARPGGRIVVVEPNRNNPLIWLQAASKRVEWGVFRTSRTSLKKVLFNHRGICRLETGTFTDLFYPYRPFPSRKLRRAFHFAEICLNKVAFTTHFYFSFIRC